MAATARLGLRLPGRRVMPGLDRARLAQAPTFRFWGGGREQGITSRLWQSPRSPQFSCQGLTLHR